MDVHPTPMSCASSLLPNPMDDLTQPNPLETSFLTAPHLFPFGQANFSSQQALKQYTDRRERDLKKQNTREHTFFAPLWNSSFHRKRPIFAIIILILAALTFIIYNFMPSFGTFIPPTSYTIDDTAYLLDLPPVGIYFWLGFLILLYIIDCCTNGVLQELNNVMCRTKFQETIDKMREINPQIVYKVSSYHNETVSVHHRVKGHSEYRTETKKVHTYSEDFLLPIKQSIDVTTDPLIFFEQAKSFRVSSFLTYSYSSPADSEMFERVKRFAEIKASRMDTYYEATEEVRAEGSVKNFVVYADGAAVDPLLSKAVWLFYSLIGLNFLYRIFLNRRVAFLELCIHKEISYDNAHQIPILTDDNLQREQIERQQRHIINNQQQIIQQNNAILSNIANNSSNVINNDSHPHKD